MLDPKIIRANTEEVSQKLAKKKYTFDVAAFNALEEQRKAIQVSTEQLQSERNTRSKSIGKAKAAGEDIAPLLKEVDALKNQLSASDEELKSIQEKIDHLLSAIPNVPAAKTEEQK